ncbi:MAG: chemotaxis protein CheX [Pseudomonadota bacterium]
MANIRKIKEMLMKAIFEVFERGFFVFAEPVQESTEDYRIRARIGFSGPMKGDMQISMSENLAKVMAKNMLSLGDDQVTDQVIADCVKECLNMICGSFVRKVDPDHVFHLTIPSFDLTSDRSDDIDAQSDSSLRLVFDTERGNFEVKMTAPSCL